MSGEQNDIGKQEDKNRWTVAKSVLEVVSAAFSVLYKFSIGVGAFVILIYLASIRFYPTLNVSDAVLLVLLAVLFGTVFALALAYGALSTLWLVTAIKWVGGLWNRRRGKQCTPSAPSALTGLMPCVVSIPCFIVFACLLFLAPHARPLLTGSIVAGFVLVTLADSALGGSTKNSEKEQSSSRAWLIKFLVVVLAVSTVLFFMIAGISTPVKMAVSFLGLRAPLTSVEVSEKERHRLSLVSESLAFPVIDCRPASDGKVLVHFVDVLWDGVGEKSRLSFEVPQGEKPLLGLHQLTPLRSAALSVDASQTSVISVKPQLPACIPYSLDRMFQEGSDEFSTTGLRLLESLILVLGRNESLPRIDLQLAVAGNGMRNHAELRARSLVARLNEGLGNGTAAAQINVEIKVGVPLAQSMPEADLFVWVGGAPDR